MNSRLFGGILLVAGTTIGAGMLALPIVTGISGFTWSSGLFVFYWLASLFTALLMLEVNLWFPGEVNLISMARRTLGRWGEALAWVVYLLLLYSLTAAYLAGSGALIKEAFMASFGIILPNWVLPLPMLIVFSYVVYHGTKWVDYLNRFLMIGKIFAYIALLAIVAPHIDMELLTHQQPAYLWMALPVVVTSFGFHIIIPSLKTYLRENVDDLRKVIIIGSSIPLIVYIVWNYVILGIVPVTGTHSLEEALVNGESVTRPLTMLLQNPYITLFSRIFGFFAISTSFLGVSLSLSDFLVDGFRIKKTFLGKIGVTMLTFLPPLLFVWLYPKGFILALQYAGAFVAILLGILPILMAWRGRPIYGPSAHYKAIGGPVLFSFGILLFLSVIGIVIIRH
jgi:tyrosine-specific transport protein